MTANAMNPDVLEPLRQRLVIQRIETTIRSSRPTLKALQRLIDAGAEHDILCGLLSDAVQPFDPSRQKARRHKWKDLDNLASELEAAGERAERIAANPFSSDAHWVGIFKISRPPVEPSEIEAIRRCAKYARENACAQRAFLTDYQKNAYRWQIGILTGYVQQKTGDPHYVEVASLLTTAFAAIGRQKAFNAESIKKARQSLLDSIELRPPASSKQASDCF